MCGEGGSTTWGFARAFQLAWQILHINHLSLGRTGLLTFHKLAHTTCSETRWRCQTGCRQVGPALLPHKTLSPLCSPWSAFLAHLPLPSSSAACVVSDSRRLSNWPQNVPGNRAKAAEVDQQLHYTVRNFRCQLNDRQTNGQRGRQNERERGQRKTDRQQSWKASAINPTHFHYNFNFDFQSRHDDEEKRRVLR